MSGKWWMGTRGSNPKPWDEWHWTELDLPVPTLVDMANMIKWARMGQHVRLEFVPDSVIDPEDKVTLGKRFPDLERRIMTQGEIEDYVRKVINTYLADDDYMVDRVVAEITYRWMECTG